MHWKKYLNIALKALLALLLLHAVMFSELAQYQDKGVRYRYIAYPLCAFAVGIFNNFIHKKVNPYPYFQDLLITSIITLDMLGNTLGFYGSIEWWDNAMHLVNCFLITIFISKLTSLYLDKNIVVEIIFIVGLISWMQIFWEIAEYITFLKLDGANITATYRDTIGDLVYGQAGLMIALIIKFYFYKINNAQN